MSLTFFQPIIERDVLPDSGRRQIIATSPKSNNSTLNLDVEVHPDAYHVSADLPGLGEEDVKLEVHHGVLTIVAEKNVVDMPQTGGAEAGRKGNVVVRRNKSRSFKCAYRLPDDVVEEHISAEMDKGVLVLTLPRRPEEAPRKIVVGGAKSQN